MKIGESIEEDRRFRIFSVSNRSLLSYLRLHKTVKRLVIGDCLQLPTIELPEDAVVRYAYPSMNSNCIHVVVHSKTFDEVPDGLDIPIIPTDYKVIPCEVGKKESE